MFEKAKWYHESKSDTLSGSQGMALWKQANQPEAVFLDWYVSKYKWVKRHSNKVKEEPGRERQCAGYWSA